MKSANYDLYNSPILFILFTKIFWRISFNLTKKKQNAASAQSTGRVRVPNPEEGEILGVIVQMLGHDRVKVKCADGHIRVGRIPGRMKKRVWLRVGDIVIIVPWDFQSTDKGDIVWRYLKTEVNWLKKKGYLTDL